MIDSRMITFLSLLALLCALFLVVVAVFSVWRLAEGSLPPVVAELREGIGTAALWLAFAVAATATFGSLWLSEVENLPPCHLCWWQRGFMYPQTLLLGVAAIGRWVWIRWISIPMVLIGAGISTYHYVLERFPEDIASSCSTDVPCTTVWIWKYHFLSIPGMAWLGFVTIAVLLALARRPDTDVQRSAGSLRGEGELELTR
ncbi:MAG: disulfide bond formation protein B [Microthrixaceae bacterium]|nr:disulfide bond formation protein B [Microthrixaceae bacterium]